MSLDHLRDAIKDAKPEGKEHAELSPAKMMAPLKFHADRNFADNVALFVKSPAAVGGNQYLSSFGNVFNELRANNPEALETLARDFPWPGVMNDEPVTTYTPVMFEQMGRIFCQIVYRVFEKTAILSKAQWNALDAMEKVANEHCIELHPKPGDMQFFNNLGLLHARRAWIDRPGKERHYYRIGFRDPELAWERPPQYAWLFNDRLEVPKSDQTIPFTDFDPYGATALGGAGHG
ncbi:hypothetical protein J4E81_008440 [Alternaria sp. BMP 2799]|nr:hypothetical protein J4E81_008440 [Alternaria sp. BMP 2799]